ncbi:hypothetical protein JTB14_009667 [Gonioctena quinquepunctata]|nr:hypothetical protein JTB14_009667 [Gonioctena quinquepunctata]
MASTSSGASSKSNMALITKEKINYLQFIGGSDSRVCIFRVCEKIFTNYSAQFCSWTGKEGNFQLSNLKIIQILKISRLVNILLQINPYFVDVRFYHLIILNTLEFYPNTKPLFSTPREE